MTARIAVFGHVFLALRSHKSYFVLTLTIPVILYIHHNKICTCIAAAWRLILTNRPRSWGLAEKGQDMQTINIKFANIPPVEQCSTYLFDATAAAAKSTVRVIPVYCTFTAQMKITFTKMIDISFSTDNNFKIRFSYSNRYCCWLLIFTATEVLMQAQTLRRMLTSLAY